MAPVVMSVYSADVSMTRCSSASVRLMCNCLTADPQNYDAVTLKQQLRKITALVSVMSLGILAVEMMTKIPEYLKASMRLGHCLHRASTWRSLQNFDHDLEGVVGRRHFEDHFSRLL